jgi:hypothetical protein
VAGVRVVPTGRRVFRRVHVTVWAMCYRVLVRSGHLVNG